MKSTKAKIVKILNHDGIPVHNHLWMQTITYFRDDIIAGNPAQFFYDNNREIRITKPIQYIREDINNLVLTTEDETYYIKKFTD